MVRLRNQWGILLAGVVTTALCNSAATVAQESQDSDIAALDTSAPSAASATEQAVPSATRLPLALPVRASAPRQTNNLFAARSWYKAPPPPPAPVEAPPPPPTAPPLPYTLAGSFEQNGTTVYFLVHGDLSYDVKVGDVVENTYSVDGVRDGQLMLTYLPLKTSQSLPLQTR